MANKGNVDPNSSSKKEVNSDSSSNERKEIQKQDSPPLSHPANEDPSSLDDVASLAIEKCPENSQLLDEISETNVDSGEATKDVCISTLKRIQKEATLKDKIVPTFSQVFCATAILLQKGATSPQSPGRTKMMVGTTSVTIEMIRKGIAVEKITVRKFARGMKDEIVDWLLSLRDRAPEGNLARSMKLDLKNVTHEECAAKQGHLISRHTILVAQAVFVFG
jgi:hypothetical protein